MGQARVGALEVLAWERIKCLTSHCFCVFKVKNIIKPYKGIGQSHELQTVPCQGDFLGPLWEIVAAFQSELFGCS